MVSILAQNDPIYLNHASSEFARKYGERQLYNQTPNQSTWTMQANSWLQTHNQVGKSKRLSPA